MNIATCELLIPGVTREIESRSNRAHHGLPARPARRSLARWLRAHLLVPRTRWLRAS